MLMTGHFFFINGDDTAAPHEPLFIARCEQILSSTPNIPTNALGVTSPSTLRFVLTDQLTISEISAKYVPHRPLVAVRMDGMPFFLVRNRSWATKRKS